MDNILKLLEDINIILKNKYYINKLKDMCDNNQPKLDSNKHGNNLSLEKSIKWGSNSCWIDSVFMAIFTYKLDIIRRNILEKKSVNVNKLGNCSSQQIQKIHKHIQNIGNFFYKNNNEDICTTTNLWLLLSECNTNVPPPGNFGMSDLLISDILTKLYKDTFIYDNLVYDVGTNDQYEERVIATSIFYILTKINEHNFNDMIACFNIYLHNVTYYPKETINIPGFKFELIGIPHSCYNYHSCSYVKTNDNQWYYYNGLGNPKTKLIEYNEIVNNLKSLYQSFIPNIFCFYKIKQTEIPLQRETLKEICKFAFEFDDFDGPWEKIWDEYINKNGA